NAGTFTNTATVTGTPPVGADVTDDDSDTQTFIQEPEIAIVKSAEVDSEDDCYDTGDIVTYTFVVTNLGNVTLENVTIDETYHFTGTGTLGAVTFVSSSMGSVEGTLLPNETATYTVEYEITQEDTDTRYIDNQAEVTGSYGDGMTVDDLSGETNADDEVTQVDLCQQPSIAIVKSAEVISDDDCYDTGDTVIYTFVVTNTGNVTLENVTIDETYHFTGTGTLGAVTFVSSSMGSAEGTLKPGESATYTAEYVITQQDTDTRFINNQAEVTGYYLLAFSNEFFVTDLSGDSVDADNETQVDLCQRPDLSIAKSLVSNDDVVGGSVNYEITVTNTGNVTLYDIYVVDDKAGLMEVVPVLAPGASISFQASVIITQEMIDEGCFYNTAYAEIREVIDEQQQPGEGEDVEYRVVLRDDSNEVEVCFTQTPEIKITKTASYDDGGDCSDVGEEILYTFVVTNTGNVTLSSVT
ncbi:DUF7507 domain-containing protein, partial [Algoriphagus zhangzhouensis]